jgi:hypothetical protein
MLVAVCTDKGSPGATTTALALSAIWPEPAVMVEADPCGGDISMRIHGRAGWLPDTPTVLTLAVNADTDPDPTVVTRCSHQIGDRLRVVPGCLVAEHASRIANWDSFAAALANSEVPVLVDVGRVHSQSVTIPILAAADVVMVVGRSTRESVTRLRERVCRLGQTLAHERGGPQRMWPVLVARHRTGPADVADLRGLFAETSAYRMLAGYGFVGWDPAGVARLESGENPTSRLAGSVLLRTAGAVAAAVSDVLSGQTVEAHL